jgi:hypothetical protein
MLPTGVTALQRDATVPRRFARTEAEATMQMREVQEMLGRVGLAVVGDQPGQRFVAFAEGEVAERAALASNGGQLMRDLAAVMRQAPGAQRSATMIDFPRLGLRFATLVPLALVIGRD